MRKAASFALGLLALLLLAGINVVPIVWGALTSIKSHADLVTYPPKILVFEATLEHYARVWSSGFGRALANSLAYALAAVVATLLLGVLAAFAFDRFRFPLRAPLFLLIVASIPLAIGSAALLVPNYLFFTYLGLTDAWFTLPLIYTAYMVPMTVWILKGAIEGVPRELDEAAAVDGASPLRVLVTILIPLIRPGIGAAGLLVFLHGWNEFVAGSVMVDRPTLRPVQVAVYQFIGYFGREWGPLTASAVLAMLPVLVIYLLFGRLLVSGLTQGAVK